MIDNIEIKKNDLQKYDRQLLAILLKDNSSKQNIIWATDNYTPLGHGYFYTDQITEESISGSNGIIIYPRIKKTKDEQMARIKNNAEVFTPSWICNKQNNLVDAAWFGFPTVFNVEKECDWQVLSRPIPFPSNGKTWQDYVKDIRLEITCGEAPYLVSRYDTISGKIISIKDRIGLLDRKLRVVSENTKTMTDWHQWTVIAFQSIYGYEWQGDNLLLARENLLATFIDYYYEKFQDIPPMEFTREIANIISWNIWQMDGLKGVIPNSCIISKDMSHNISGKKESVCLCEGCAKNDISKHNGIYCRIKDWSTGKTIKYTSLINPR